MIGIYIVPICELLPFKIKCKSNIQTLNNIVQKYGFSLLSFLYLFKTFKLDYIDVASKGCWYFLILFVNPVLQNV